MAWRAHSYTGKFQLISLYFFRIDIDSDDNDNLPSSSDLKSQVVKYEIESEDDDILLSTSDSKSPMVKCEIKFENGHDANNDVDAGHVVAGKSIIFVPSSNSFLQFSFNSLGCFIKVHLWASNVLKGELYYIFTPIFI